MAGLGELAKNDHLQYHHEGMAHEACSRFGFQHSPHISRAERTDSTMPVKAGEVLRGATAAGPSMMAPQGAMKAPSPHVAASGEALWRPSASSTTLGPSSTENTALSGIEANEGIAAEALATSLDSRRNTFSSSLSFPGKNGDEGFDQPVAMSVTLQERNCPTLGSREQVALKATWQHPKSQHVNRNKDRITEKDSVRSRTES